MDSRLRLFFATCTLGRILTNWTTLVLHYRQNKSRLDFAICIHCKHFLAKPDPFFNVCRNRSWIFRQFSLSAKQTPGVHRWICVWSSLTKCTFPNSAYPLHISWGSFRSHPSHPISLKVTARELNIFRTAPR